MVRAARRSADIDDVGRIEQPSVQWHVAQMLDHLRDDLSEEQARRGPRFSRTTDRLDGLIVLNVTMDVLAGWAGSDQQLARWLAPVLDRLRGDRRASVAKRAARRLGELRTSGS